MIIVMLTNVVVVELCCVMLCCVMLLSLLCYVDGGSASDSCATWQGNSWPLPCYFTV